MASRVYRHQARFLVHAPADQVRTQVSASVAVVVDAGDGRCELRSGADDLDFVLLHVARLGHRFTVLDPPELRERCTALAELIRAAARPPA